MNAKLEKFDKENYLHVASALNVARWTEAETGSMLPVTPQDICGHEYGVLATGFVNGLTIKTAGYVAIKEVSTDGKIGQIGSFVVNPDGRGQGLGARLLDFVLKWHKDTLPELEEIYSYVNYKSLPIFLDAGGHVTSKRETPSLTNCVFIVDLTPALKGITSEGSGIL